MLSMAVPVIKCGTQWLTLMNVLSSLRMKNAQQFRQNGDLSKNPDLTSRSDQAPISCFCASWPQISIVQTRPDIEIARRMILPVVSSQLGRPAPMLPVHSGPPILFGTKSTVLRVRRRLSYLHDGDFLSALTCVCTNRIKLFTVLQKHHTGTCVLCWYLGSYPLITAFFTIKFFLPFA